jgi:hypothetical protein
MRSSNVKGKILKIGASIPFTVGLVGFVFYLLSISYRSWSPVRFQESIWWFGGVLPYSFDFFRSLSPVSADLLTIQYPLFALGPHLCGAGGFLYIADGIVLKRSWALFVLFCVIVVAGINDTCGAYIYYLKTGDMGFIVPLTATSLGTCGLLLFLDCLKTPQRFIRFNKSSLGGNLFSFGRMLAVSATFMVAIVWIFAYASYFLPAYLLRPDEPSKFFGKLLPSFHEQLDINRPDSREYQLKSSYFYGFSVMTAQMAWAAGSIGFGVSPLIASYFGLMDADASLRDGCIAFLWYVSLCCLGNVFVRPPLETEAGRAVGEMVYSLLFFYGSQLAVSALLLTIGRWLGSIERTQAVKKD